MFFGIFLKNFLLLQVDFTKYCKNWWKCCRKQWKYEKKFNQKSITLAHSGGHNLIKIRFCLFSVTMVQNFVQYAWKLVQIDRVLEKVKKNGHYGPISRKKLYRFFLIHVFWCLEGPQHTVGNRVVKTSRFCFFAFYSIVNTPTMKKPHRETPCYLSVLRYRPSKSKSKLEKLYFFSGCDMVNFGS